MREKPYTTLARSTWEWRRREYAPPLSDVTSGRPIDTSALLYPPVILDQSGGHKEKGSSRVTVTPVTMSDRNATQGNYGQGKNKKERTCYSGRKET